MRKTKTHFQYRIDMWDDVGGEIMQHVAGADDFEVATATYTAAVKRWPAARIMRNAALCHEPTFRIAADFVIRSRRRRFGSVE